MPVARGMMKQSGVSNLIRKCDKVVAISRTTGSRCREYH
jgi:hypothetical protein